MAALSLTRVITPLGSISTADPSEILEVDQTTDISIVDLIVLAGAKGPFVP